MALFGDLPNIITRNSPPKAENLNTLLLNLFFALQAFGLVGVTVILLTVLLSRTITKRHPTWNNFLLSWIISCVSYILLVGRPIDWQPSYGLCLAQAALIYAVPTLTAWTTLSLVIFVLFTLLISPYLAASGMLAATLVVGLRDPGTVRRSESGMYCHLEAKLIGKISSISVTLAMIATFALEVVMATELHRHWLHFKRDGQSLSMILRVMGFSMFGVLAIALGLVFFFTDNHGPALNIVIALIPVGAVFVFGTQRDIVQVWVSGVWMLCGRKDRTTESEGRTKESRTTVTTTGNGSQDPIIRHGQHIMMNGSQQNTINGSHHTINGSRDTLIGIGTAL